MALKVVSKKSKEKPKINPKQIARQRLANLDKEIIDSGVPNFSPIETGGMLNIDNDYLTLPRDMTEIPSRELGNFLNAFTQQKAYMRTLIGWQELATEGAKRNYYDKYTPYYAEYSKSKMSETSKETLINNLDDVKKHFLNYKDEKQKLKMLNYSLYSIEDSIFLISREISRRTGDFSSEIRNDNVQRR